MNLKFLFLTGRLRYLQSLNKPADKEQQRQKIDEAACFGLAKDFVYKYHVVDVEERNRQGFFAVQYMYNFVARISIFFSDE